MRNAKQQNTVCHTNRLPPILAAFNSILIHQDKGIEEHLLGCLEGDPVLAQIYQRLSGIPFKIDTHAKLLLQNGHNNNPILPLVPVWRMMPGKR